MYLLYAFLMNIEDVDEEAPDLQIRAAIEGDFHTLYALNHCQETNWYVPHLLISGDGRTVVFSREDEEAPPELARVLEAPQDRRRDLAVELAIEKVVRDMAGCAGLPGRGGTFSDVRVAVSKRLAEMYLRLADEGGKEEKPDACRRRLSEMYELLMSAKTAPFSLVLRSPYVYRAYDLTGGESGQQGAILFVDINVEEPLF